MKLTNHEEYGLRCLLRLAEQGPGGSLTIPEISRTEGISEAYAGKLLRILRRGGFVKAARGKIGGYALARPAAKIAVGDVMAALGGPFFEDGFCQSHTGQAATCVRTTDCSLRGLWRTIQAAVDGVLREMTLDRLVCEQPQLVVWPPADGGWSLPRGDSA
jgi:Rrf2 family protein